MRSLGWLGGVLLLILMNGAARADAPKPVNLLTSAPTTVAVSSTVDNLKIVPAHLVDGNPKTAWNSRTGELVGAWIAFRVPADARVTAIKLTAGFTHVDPKLGDLFTANPRIKRVRIEREGKALAELALDPASRAPQPLAINAAGGDFQITVLEIVPGTRKDWREICVSELEVWGTLAPATAPRPQTPAVRVGSLDAPPMLTRPECVKAVIPTARGNRVSAAKDAGTITSTEELGLSPAVTICRIDHKPPGSIDATVEVAAVDRATRKIIGRQSIALQIGPDPELRDQKAHDDSVDVKLVPLTTTETALLISRTAHETAPMSDARDTRSTLYRVTSSALIEVLSFESFSHQGEGGRSDRCELRAFTLSASLPARLRLDCEETVSDWHNPDMSQRGTKATQRVDTYRWNGTRYEKSP